MHLELLLVWQRGESNPAWTPIAASGLRRTPLPRAFTGTLPSHHLTVAFTTSCLAEAEDPPRSCQLA